MKLGMVVHGVIDSVAPGPVPAIRLDQRVDIHVSVREMPAAQSFILTAEDDHRKAWYASEMNAVIGDCRDSGLRVGVVDRITVALCNDEAAVAKGASAAGRMRH